MTKSQLFDEAVDAAAADFIAACESNLKRTDLDRLWLDLPVGARAIVKNTVLQLAVARREQRHRRKQTTPVQQTKT